MILGRIPAPNRIAMLVGLIVAALLGRTAVTSPRLAVGAVIGMILVVITLWRLLAGVVVFTILTFPESLPSSIGVATFAKPLGLVITVSWLLSLAGRRERIPLLVRDQPFLSVAIISFTAWAISSAVWASDVNAAEKNATRLVLTVVLLFIIYSAIREPRDVRVMTWAYLAGAFATSVYALASGVVYEGRITGGIVNPNFFAAELVVSLVLGGFMLAVARRADMRLLLAGFLLTYGISFVLTQSRGGLIALATALVVAVVVAGPIRPQVVVTILVVLALALTYYVRLAPQSLRDRVTNISAQGSAGRADEWRIALRIGADHPLLGVGLGNYPVVSPQYAASTINLIAVRHALQGSVAHNTYFETFSELGGVGLTLLLAILGATLATAIRGIRSLSQIGDLETAILARGLVAGVIGLLVAYGFGSGEYQKQLWVLLGLLIAIPAAAGRFANQKHRQEVGERYRDSSRPATAVPRS